MRLSAFGGQYSDIVYEAGFSIQTDSADYDYAALRAAFDAIDQRLGMFERSLPAGLEGVHRERFLEARYAHQAWTIELPLADRPVSELGDAQRIAQDFHGLHQRLFATSDPGEVVEILQCRGRTVARPFTPVLGQIAGAGVAAAPRTRRAFFTDTGEVDVQVLDGAPCRRAPRSTVRCSSPSRRRRSSSRPAHGCAQPTWAATFWSSR